MSQYLLSFDGINDYIEIDSSKDFSVSTTGFLTVSAWIQPTTLKFPRTDGSGYVNWLGKGKMGNHEWTFRMYSKNNTENRDNRISFYLFNLAGGKGIGSYFEDKIVPGEWIHVVGACDKSKTYIYKNGILRKCDVYRGYDNSCHEYPEDSWITPKHGTAPLRIGHRDGNSYFQGIIAKVRFWNRKLTDNEIKGVYKGVIPFKGLISEYLLNTPTDRIAKDTYNKHNGRIIGATWIKC